MRQYAKSAIHLLAVDSTFDLFYFLKNNIQITSFEHHVNIFCTWSINLLTAPDNKKARHKGQTLNS